MQRYGQTFKKIRANKCLTQARVASTDLSQSLYAKIEKDEVMPNFLKFNSILKNLDITYNDFFSQCIQAWKKWGGKRTM
ncbi:helix-turn-helix transcriptional regulator [Listeria rocourtiae]|uniref:helix-turn-helix domain-containing protein n=1 Tax=Listeria rocourtiae TaxID=647910 RepID=UPI001623AABF|nr:helix-turn-helix transcriptional regulator [Listeria rocourtiae]MBC1436489.1 helix-turn-helix transcriptional regulator [Listeria rocourtiae]